MSTESHFDPDEIRRAAMMDGSGFSHGQADYRTSDEQIPGTTELPIFAREQRSPRPTGKHRVEPSGGDISRMLANQDEIDHPMTPEQRKAAAKKGAPLARKALEAVTGDAITRRVQQATDMVEIRPDYVAEDIAARDQQITAFLRTDFDKKQ